MTAVTDTRTIEATIPVLPAGALPMRTVIAVLFLSICGHLMAQTPYLVKDINTTGLNQFASSSPSNFVRFGSRVLFSTRPPTGGAALWSTDGTANGTQHIIDIKAYSPAPSRFVALNGKVLFNLTSDSTGEELWTTDGTAAGTRLLTDSATGFAFAGPRDRIVYHDRMIFAATAHVPGEFSYRGNAVWITDGSSSGTRALAAAPYWGSNSHVVLFKDALYFAAGGFLWKSDGTESGTVKVKAVSTMKIAVTSFGLFFMGFTKGVGWEPWVSDGTEGGTHPIGSTARADGDGLGHVTSDDTSYATAFGDRVLFTATDLTMVRGLWISDGTAAGTHVVHDLSSAYVNYRDPLLTIAGDRAFFSTYTSSSGIELWKTDSTEAGTTMVLDIAPGEQSSGISSLVAVGDKVYFSALTNPYSGPWMLWVSDGTSAGTHKVKDSYPIVAGIPTNIDGILYFSGSDDVNGQEPWKSDGTDTGTSMIANLYPESGPPSDPFELVAAGDWVYFKASSNGKTFTLWRSDGTSAGTLNVGLYPYFSVAIGRSLLFSYYVYERINGSYLERGVYGTSDGTPEGTAYSDALTRRFPPFSYPYRVLGDKLLLAQGESSLWAATIASDAPPVPLGVATPYCPANFAGRLLFLDKNQQSLMTTDGTLKGTYEIARLGDPAGCPVVFKGNVFFSTTNNSTLERKIWKTDGTFDGTTVVMSFPPGVYTGFTAAGRNLFIILDGDLWVTDGTEGGMHRLPVRLGTLPLMPVGDRIVFPKFDAATGVELWTSDGTVPGTHIVTDLYPGPEGSNPKSLATIGALVYFQANDGLRGNEPWVTDGTAAGTKLVADIEPGPEGSMGSSWSGWPDGFVQAGNRIFFTATTRALGRELWAMSLDATPSLTIDDLRVTESDGNDVVARFTVTLSSPASKNVTVDFATENGTAAAGADYETRSGTLTFSAGETTKSIDVHTHGNSIPENNKTFLLTLRNPTGAILAKTIAYALIEDDDQLADVALALDFSNINTNQVRANASNNGPRAANAVTVTTTVTPSLGYYNVCGPCTLPPLPSGTSAPAFTLGSVSTQQFLTATATSFQRDTQPANNSAAWIMNGSMAMDALYLTPGSQANVWFSVPANASNITVASSEPAVISLSTSIPAFGANRTATVLARGLRIGKATLMVLAGATIIRSLDVEVVATGNTPRWPGAIKLSSFNSRTAFDQKAPFTIAADGIAPFSGATATGLVTISSNGKELGRVTLTATMPVADAQVYLPAVGVNPITMEYAGDVNFLPMTLTSFSVTATIGIPSITVTSTRTGSSVKIHVRAAGSPVAAPTGTLDITAPGTQIHAQATLATTAPGVAEAEVTVVDAGEKSHAVHVVYPGDAHYASATRDRQTVDLRHRAGGR
jgi:ELWxxDGT repeat protein